MTGQIPIEVALDSRNKPDRIKVKTAHAHAYSLLESSIMMKAQVGPSYLSSQLHNATVVVAAFSLENFLKTALMISGHGKLKGPDGHHLRKLWDKWHPDAKAEFSATIQASSWTTTSNWEVFLDEHYEAFSIARYPQDAVVPAYDLGALLEACQLIHAFLCSRYSFFVSPRFPQNPRHEEWLRKSGDEASEEVIFSAIAPTVLQP